MDATYARLCARAAADMAALKARSGVIPAGYVGNSSHNIGANHSYDSMSGNSSKFKKYASDTNSHNTNTSTVTTDRIDAVALNARRLSSLQNDELLMDVPNGYVPISVDSVNQTYDSIVTLCRIPYDLYALNPSRTPMYADVIKSFCPRFNTIQRRLSVLEQLPFTMQPSGFILHETRTGSTIAAEILATDPANMVYSEALWSHAHFTKCKGCTRERLVHLTRVLYNAMGNSKAHSRMYFKYASAIWEYVDVLLAVYPDTPWIFMFRESAEVLGSYQDANNLHDREEVTVLRAKGALSAITLRTLQYIHGLNQRAEALLNMTNSRGIAVHYHSIPLEFIDVVVPYHFNQPLTADVHQHMIVNGAVYSKVMTSYYATYHLMCTTHAMQARAKHGAAFQDDSKVKESKISDEVCLRLPQSRHSRP